MRVALIALALATGGCSDARKAAGAGDSTRLARAARDSSGAAVPVSAPVTRDDLAKYRRGVAAEIDTMRAIVAAPGFTRAAGSRPGSGQAALTARLDSVGARAAGVNIERFRDTIRRVHGVLRALSTVTVVAAVLDTASLSARDRPAARAQLRDVGERAFRGVNPASAAIVRPEAASLDSLRMRFVAFGMRVGRP